MHKDDWYVIIIPIRHFAKVWNTLTYCRLLESSEEVSKPLPAATAIPLFRTPLATSASLGW